MLEGVLLSLIAGVVGIVIGTFGATSLANLLLPQPAQAGNGLFNIRNRRMAHMLTSAAISVTITPELMLLGLGFCSPVRCTWKLVSCVESSKNTTSGGNAI